LAISSSYKHRGNIDNKGHEEQKTYVGDLLLDEFLLLDQQILRFLKLLERILGGHWTSGHLLRLLWLFLSAKESEEKLENHVHFLDGIRDFESLTTAPGWLTTKTRKAKSVVHKSEF
jgi:hypothetical protein